ncbi:MAG: hypothetical protein I3J02_07295 [Prevotella sp.]|nr:hypothetical protein [Prevotella sp.]
MNNPLKIFCIRKEEKWLAIVTLLVFVALNAVMIGSHWAAYTEGQAGGFWTVFTHRFSMSGYDCWSWITVSGMRIHFETIRHPLYLTFLYPMYLLNHWLMGWTDVNFAVFMIAAVLIFSAIYSAIFMYRTFREILLLEHRHALLLVALLFSFGHVMIPPMVPDHFAISMMLLTMTLYIAGRRMQKGRTLKAWQSMVLLFFTSGIAASNGAKTLLSALFVNGKRFFRPGYLFVGAVLPLVALLAIQRYQYESFEVPQQKAIEKIEKANAKKRDKKKIAATENHNQWVKKHDMKRAAHEGLLQLMDFKTPRTPAIIEDFFGESILLHRDHALGDVYVDRPSMIYYHAWWYYAIEAIFVLLFVYGVWLGRKHHLMQMMLCWFAFDVTLNLILGFAINEVYIMASGWIFIIPIAIGYIIKALPKAYLFPLEALLLFLALFLWVNNATLIVNHLI